MAPTQLAAVGVSGLEVLPRNLARNLARNGRVIAVHTRSGAKTRALVEGHGDEGTFVAAESVVQGLRDKLGARTNGRVDRPGAFHTQWSQGSAEVQIS